MRYLLIAFMLLLHMPASAAPLLLEGVVSDVIDGDTFRMGGEKFRLWGVDALEKTQTCTDGTNQTYNCGVQARLFLERMIKGQFVSCTRKGVSYDRTVALCSIGRIEINQAMVRNGWARDCHKYSRGKYSTDEAYARDRRMGMWQGSSQAPWQFRHGADC